MKQVYFHVTDAPVTLHSNEILEDTHFILTGTEYGRFLFKMDYIIQADGQNIIIRNNLITGCIGGDGYTSPLDRWWYDKKWKFKSAFREARRYPLSIWWAILKYRWTVGG